MLSVAQRSKSAFIHITSSNITSSHRLRLKPKRFSLKVLKQPRELHCPIRTSTYGDPFEALHEAGPLERLVGACVQRWVGLRERGACVREEVQIF